MEIKTSRCSEEAHNTEGWTYLSSAGFSGSNTEASRVFLPSAAVNYSSPTRGFCLSNALFLPEHQQIFSSFGAHLLQAH